MSFISTYLKATEGNESPLGYHLWSCIATLSAAAGRRFWFNLGRLTYYPNIYVLLVGEPGVKKTTSMNFGKELIQSTGVCPIAASQTTREFLGKAMSDPKFKGKKFFEHEGVLQEYNQYAVFATEFTQFIAVNPEGMLEFFTAVYDEKIHSADYKNAGSDYVIGPYFTLLGCLTPHMLKGYLKTNVLTGGFARRTIFVYGTRERIIAIPKRPPKEYVDYLKNFIAMLQEKSGEFKFGEGAEEWYVSWYTNLQHNLKDIAKPSTEGYFTTKQELLIKTAMLIALGESDGDAREILPAHFEIAEEKFFSVVEANLERVFEGAGINPNAQAAVQVCRMIEALGEPIGRKIVEGIFYDQVTDVNSLRDMLDHLIMVGRLTERKLMQGPVLIGTILASPGIIEKYSAGDLERFLRPGKHDPVT